MVSAMSLFQGIACTTKALVPTSKPVALMACPRLAGWGLPADFFVSFGKAF